MLEEGPAGANQNDREEQQPTLEFSINLAIDISIQLTSTYLEEVRDVVEHGPGLDVIAVGLNLVVVDAVEEQREALQVDQSGHDPVDAEHLLQGN